MELTKDLANNESESCSDGSDRVMKLRVLRIMN